MTILIEGSPRQVNGSYLAEKIAARYEDVETLRLADIKFKGCTGCQSCRENNSFCIQADELMAWFPKFAQAGKIILIAPNYMGALNGQSKLLIDRLYCMRDTSKRSRFKEGTKFAFFLTQSSPNSSGGEPVVQWLKKVTEHYALKFYGFVIPNCSYDNTDGVRLKQEEMRMSLGFFF